MNFLTMTKRIKLSNKPDTLVDKFWMWYYDSWIYNLYKYSWLYDLRWKVTHWCRKDHWVKTNLSCNYHDNRELMDAALFALVENYVARDQEDAFSVVNYDTELIEIKEKIIKILHFYRVRRPELQKIEDDLLHECFGPVKMVFTPCEDRPGFSKLNMSYEGSMSEEEREDKIKEMRDLEVQIFEETQEILKLCVDVRPYLWT